MSAWILLAMITSAPAASSNGPTGATLSNRDKQTVTRLTAFIVARHRRPKRAARVAAYAGILAQRIVIEARRYRIPVATFAAIAWAESWFWKWCAGTSHEYGVWQIWPYSGSVKRGWDKLRAEGRIGAYPDKPWAKLGYSVRRRILGDVVTSTALAAYILRALLQWCRRKHKVYRARLLGSRRHRYATDRAAHYNSGRRWPRPGYYYQLRRYSRTLRNALYGRRKAKGGQ